MQRLAAGPGPRRLARLGSWRASCSPSARSLTRCGPRVVDAQVQDSQFYVSVPLATLETQFGQPANVTFKGNRALTGGALVVVSSVVGWWCPLLFILKQGVTFSTRALDTAPGRGATARQRGLHTQGSCAHTRQRRLLLVAPLAQASQQALVWEEWEEVGAARAGNRADRRHIRGAFAPYLVLYS